MTLDLRTHVHPGRTCHFFVRRTLIGYTKKIQTWVDIFSLSGADLLTGQCHSQFEMDRINICGIFETIRVVQGQDGLPQSQSSFYVKIQTVRNKIKNCQYWETCRCVSHFRSKGFTVCALRYCFFCHAVCRRYKWAHVDRGPTMLGGRTVQFQFEMLHLERFTLIWDLQIWNTDFVSYY